MSYTFTYRAMNDAGRTVKGEMTAENELDLEAKLKTLGMDIVDYREVKPRKAGMFSKVKMKDMIIFCMHMEQLDRAGVPLHEAMEDARDATDSLKLQNVLTSVYEDIKAGKVFSKALSEHPTVFNEIFIGLIAAGEKTGNLQESFLNLCEHMKWVAELRRKVRKAIAYPIVLGVVLTAVITVLMLFVVPQLIKFITSQGFDIPIHTRALIVTSEFFGAYWYIVLPAPIVLMSILFACYRASEAFAYRVDAMMLRAPLIGQVVRKINMARFTHFFAVMFSSGIDILDSLLAGRDVIKNRVLRESVELVHRSVMDGNRLTESIRMSNQFPNLVVRMFRIGEESGNLSESLENINYFYKREVDDAVERLVGMIQPIMTVVMGGIIFWVIAAVFGPLYDSFSNIDF
ncbi:MAG: type II secretion system F family protein [Alphaproteobacteria bacterium]|nr:MAG: type II secretion system F family protein [Alphaproteobacteria bacterium]TAF13031.1 MAG: type II secretion system F family protein [Alphaproteobacteria bacterium]TAF76724.1 MAG: type II secretion system F family protein [Alphaproteobacteria bacterium]